MSVIKVENLSKQYRLGQVGTGSLAHDINRIWHRARGKEDPYLKIGEENNRETKGNSEYVWALQNINFEIEQGDRVGIIGRNGAGKSTLLKILSRTTSPTSGSVKIKGKVASLLEVGTGFHPDLSGRDNIFLNGAILGMSRRDIKNRFEEIVDFAGVERYIDSPVKRYSSGMYVRLAFAVAAHLESDILIVDEVLAVGDAEFQKKCLGKMGEVSQGQGKTVIFVSHQVDAITRLCNRTIVIKNGMKTFDGDPLKGTQLYLDRYTNNAAYKKWSRLMPGNDTVNLLEVSVINGSLQLSEVFEINEEIRIKIKYEVLVDEVEVIPGINLFNEANIHLFSSHDIETGKNRTKFFKGLYEAIVLIPENFLSEGQMNVSVAMMSYDPFVVHFHEKDLILFTVVDNLNLLSARGVYGGNFPGVVRPILRWINQPIQDL